METQETQSTVATADTPTNTKLPHPRELTLSWQTILEYAPVTGWCALSVFWLCHYLHFLLAVPLGCLMGVILYFLVGQLINSGTNNLMELNIGSSIGLVMALILVPVFLQAREKARAINCLQSVKAASLALVMYAENNDGCLPPDDSWETKIHSYVPKNLDKNSKEIQIGIQCPLAPAGSGYGLYQPLAGGTLESVANLEATPLVFDANVTTANAVATVEQLPAPGRHHGGNIIGYADGHAKWQEMKPLPPTRKMYASTRAPRRVVSRP